MVPTIYKLGLTLGDFFGDDSNWVQKEYKVESETKTGVESRDAYIDNSHKSYQNCR